MSMIYKKVLVAAIAMGLTTAAIAGEVTTNTSTPAAYVHAWELNGNTTAASNTAANSGVIGYSISSGDNAVLRAQPIKVVIKPTGAKFTSLALSAMGAQGTPGSVTVDGAGNATFEIAAPTGNLFGTGNLFTVAVGGALLNSVPSAQNGQVSFAIELRDPVTNALLDSASGQVMTVAQATAVTVKANASPTAINVGALPARTKFVGGIDFVNLGVVSVGLKDYDSVATGDQVASGRGSAVTANVDTSSNLFKLDASSDKIDFVVTAENGAAFRTISTLPTPVGYNGDAGIRYVEAGVACAAGVGSAMGEAANNSNVFMSKIVVTPLMITNGIRLCAETNGVTAIAAQTFSVSAKLDLTASGTQDPAAVSGALATLAYNGVSIDVDHINPASNADQQSYLRITNTSAISGNVRISGINDNGTAGAGTPSFVLGAGKSILVTSQDLEFGNAAKGIVGGFGASAVGGKWRATVTAELPTGNVKVQNFLRNTTSAGLINTNVNIEK